MKDVCIHKMENMNSLDLNNTRGPLMYVDITAVWTVLVSSFNCNILRFLMTGRVTGTSSTSSIYDTLFIIPVKMAPWC